MAHKSISVSADNYEFLMTLAAKISDATGTPVSANTAVTKLKKMYEASNES